MSELTARVLVMFCFRYDVSIVARNKNRGSSLPGLGYKLFPNVEKESIIVIASH